jgi:hypothetical protein
MNLNELQKLMDDLARNKGPSHSDLESRDDELRAAFDAHPEWMEQMRKRDEFDAKLCKVMPQVEIPEGLKERLLDGLDESQVPAAPAADRHRRSRRRALATFTAATALAAVAVWFGLRLMMTPKLNVADVNRELPKLWEAPDGDFPDADPARTALPSGWNTSWLRVSHDWKTHDVSGEALAFCRLKFISDRGRIHTGLLAALPSSSFSPETQPTSTYAFFSHPSYLKTSSGLELAIVSWTDPQKERVYFLAVPAADHTLKALEELLNAPPV